MGLPSDAGESLWEISADGKNLRQLHLKPPSASSVCCGSWTPDGRYYVFTAFQNGQADVWAARDGRSWRRSAHREYQLTFGPNSAFSGAAGRDGKHIFFYSGVWRQQLQTLDLRTRQFIPLSIAGNAIHLSYSKDGKWIAYVDGQGRGLLRCRVDGSDQVQLASADPTPSFPRWSPDGKRIIFMTAKGTVDIVPSAGGHAETLLPTEAEVNDPDWSNDGTHVVFSRKSGGKDSDSRELVILDVAAKRTEKIPDSDHLAMSRWSPDGRYISATSDQQNQLKLWDTSKKEWRVIARGEALGVSVWSPDARYLYFQDLLGAGEQLYRYDLSTRSIKTVVDFSVFLKSGVSRCALLSMAPDGSPIIGFTRSNYDLFAAEVVFP
jgi:Tol biopolymer transport system component